MLEFEHLSLVQRVQTLIGFSTASWMFNLGFIDFQYCSVRFFLGGTPKLTIWETRRFPQIRGCIFEIRSFDVSFTKI